jgi:hypothetical protein
MRDKRDTLEVEMRVLQGAAALLLITGSMAVAADTQQTWTGIISDSHCGAIHKTDIEHGGSITARECVIGRPGDANLPGCVSEKYGAKFVVVVGDKVYQVANQEFADLRVQAARNVRVTGVLKGDTITVSKISPNSK